MKNKSNDRYYYLGFSHFEGIGPNRLSLLIKYFGSVEKAYEAEKKELINVIGPNLTSKFIKFRNLFDPVKKLWELKTKRISIITLGESVYPKPLSNISDPPVCLYARGDVGLLGKNNLSFAVVGTRTPTPYGRQLAGKFSTELAEAGFIIASGMALGIDSAAHWAAVEGGLKTTAVLGCGVDVIYPATNRHLYYKIAEKGGLIISEFPPGRFMEKGLFIARNRIISGISEGVLVIEGSKDSGALITARFAAEQGKEVFALPGPVNSPMSQAPNLLIKQGAKLTTSINDILDELGMKTIPAAKKKAEIQLDEKEKTIFNLLQSEALTIDDIASKTKKTLSEMLETVSIMEIKNVVEKNGEGKYQIKI